MKATVTIKLAARNP